MRTYKIIGLLVLAVAFALFTRNNAHAIGKRAHPLLAAFQVQAATSGSQLQILAPQSGQKITSNSVTVTYALSRTATVQSSPTFQIRLDANDPVSVTDTSYTFSGLQPGKHTILIQALDANGIPVPNTQGEVQFIVLAAQAGRYDEAQEPLEAGTLPSDPSDGPLSVLGVVGFGVLVGGALSLYHNRSDFDAEDPSAE